MPELPEPTIRPWESATVGSVNCVATRPVRLGVPQGSRGAQGLAKWGPVNRDESPDRWSLYAPRMARQTTKPAIAVRRMC
jgi:hypothetical protein